MVWRDGTATGALLDTAPLGASSGSSERVLSRPRKTSNLRCTYHYGLDRGTSCV